MEFAKLTIDETEYTLAYDFNEICKAEEFTGVNLLSAIENLRYVTAAQLRGLFWAALESGPDAAFPKKTRQQSLEMVGALMRIDTLLPITEALAEAYTLSIPKAMQDEGDEAAAAAAADETAAA